MHIACHSSMAHPSSGSVMHLNPHTDPPTRPHTLAFFQGGGTCANFQCPPGSVPLYDAAGNAVTCPSYPCMMDNCCAGCLCASHTARMRIGKIRTRKMFLSPAFPFSLPVTDACANYYCPPPLRPKQTADGTAPAIITCAGYPCTSDECCDSFFFGVVFFFCRLCFVCCCCCWLLLRFFT